jgi:hypothetical protein
LDYAQQITAELFVDSLRDHNDRAPVRTAGWVRGREVQALQLRLLLVTIGERFAIRQQ